MLLLDFISGGHVVMGSLALWGLIVRELLLLDWAVIRENMELKFAIW